TPPRPSQTSSGGWSAMDTRTRTSPRRSAGTRCASSTRAGGSRPGPMPLVAAVACPPTPPLLVRPDPEDPAPAPRVHPAYRRVRDLPAATRPDAIAVVAGDHIEAFFLDAAPAFAVHAGARAAGAFGRYRYDFPVDESLARAIVEEAGARDFDLL